MANFTIKKHFEAPLELSFELLSDFEHAAKNIRALRQLEVLTPGAIGVGTRLRETREMFGKETSEEMEVTAFDPPHGYTVECDSCGGHYCARYGLVSDIAGTHVRLEFDVRPVSLMAKLLAPLSWIMLGSLRKMVEADLDDLKEVAEVRALELADNV